MRPFFLVHPSTASLASSLHHADDPATRPVLEHLAGCVRCRATIQLLRQAEHALVDSGLPEPPADLRARVLASRSAGDRVVLPTAQTQPVPSRGRRWLQAAGAAAIVLVALVAESGLPTSRALSAGSNRGTLVISPTLPRPGATVSLAYTAPASLERATTFSIRARFRTAESVEYEQGALPTRVVAIATRDGNGKYQARLTLPPGVVFAALALEDPASGIIDDNGLRTWEILTSLDGSRPSLDAMQQRVHDLMGRNFEEGRRAAVSMHTAYPDTVGSRLWERLFDVWSGAGDVDSLLTPHRRTVTALTAAARAGEVLSPVAIARTANYARMVDSAAFAYWKPRLLQSAPRTAYGVMWRTLDARRAMWTTGDSARALETFENLWHDRVPSRAADIAGSALEVAIARHDSVLVTRWASRLLGSVTDTLTAAIGVAEQQLGEPAWRPTVLRRLEQLVARLERAELVPRLLSETSATHHRRVAAIRRRALAALGRGLVADGAHGAGLDKLRAAAEAGWDPAIIRAARTASFAIGDSTTGWAMSARLLADPSTGEGLRAEISQAAVRHLGDPAWAQVRQDASRLFAERIVAEGARRSLATTGRLRTPQGELIELSRLVRGRLTVIAITSRHCGWAIDDMASMQAVANRLEALGGQMIVVMDGDPGPSPALDAFLRAQQLSVPIYFDVEHSVIETLNAWGTPYYFVLDPEGALRFPRVHRAIDALVRAEALRIFGQSQ